MSEEQKKEQEKLKTDKVDYEFPMPEFVLNLFLKLIKRALDDGDAPQECKDDSMLLMDDILKMKDDTLKITTHGAMQVFVSITNALEIMMKDVK